MGRIEPLVREKINICGSRDAGLEEQLQNGGFIRRIVREVLPFGGIYMK
ncbi:hypothetical protein [Paenibacillus sp. Soil522]|nr:hypothetical protein [Paenibacillus sp. Soil522]